MEKDDEVCAHGTAMDVHCCNCHSGFIFEPDHECPDVPRRCSWLQRWFHRRLRQADRKFMIPLLVGNARLMSDEPKAALRTFLMFTRQPGQEHWGCQCCTADLTEVLDLLVPHGEAGNA